MAKTKTSGPLLIGEHTINKDDLTKNQKEADAIFYDWYTTIKTRHSQILRIGGFSGSGKSFFIRYLIGRYNLDTENCMVMSYTGQAVNNLRQNGVLAKTIHSSIMQVEEVPLLDKHKHPVFRKKIPVMTVRFKPIKRLPSTIKLLIVDEASFLPETLEDQLSHYGIPILEVGDPLQLPPVSGKQCFHMDNVDYFLTTIMRQNQDSEIIDLSMRIRNYDKIDKTKYHKDVWFLHNHKDIEADFNRYYFLYKGSDMIITSTNKQRQAMNDLYREYILKAKSPFPQKGERLICRKNNWNLMLGDFPLTNGTQGTCLNYVGHSMVDKKLDCFYMDFRPTFISNKYYDNMLCDTEYLRSPVGSDKYLNFRHPGEKLEYAYAITCHLSQGSQYDTVFFMDTRGWDQEYQMRLRYTAVTRAVNRLYYLSI